MHMRVCLTASWFASHILAEREASFIQMDRHWRRLLEKRDTLDAVKVLQEVQTSASGILQRTNYAHLWPSPGRAQIGRAHV